MRSETVKAGCTVTLLGVALLAGAYASGWLMLKLLGVSVLLKVFTYYDYVRALDRPQGCAIREEDQAGRRGGRITA